MAADPICALRALTPTLGEKVKVAASALEDAFILSASPDAIFGRMADCDDTEGGLRLVCYIAATGCEDIMPAQAGSICLAYVMALQKAIGGITALWRGFLAYLEEYWTQTFKRSRFHFAAPVVTEAELKEAVAAPEERRAQAILRAVADGLRLPVPEPTRAWLRSGL